MRRARVLAFIKQREHGPGDDHLDERLLIAPRGRRHLPKDVSLGAGLEPGRKHWC